MKKWFFTAIGAFLMAVGLNEFLAPHNLVIGGATGISLIVLRIFNIPMWLTNIIINIPLLAVSIWLKGRRFTINTMCSTLLLSFFIGITEGLPLFETDMLLGAVFGGLISGVGLGLVFKGNTTTGGTDLAATLIRIYMPHLSAARIMLILDVVIIITGFFVLGPSAALYALITVYIISKTIDIVLEGLDFAKAAFIISDKAEAIGLEITKKLRRGATLFKGKGMYTNSDKNMIIVVTASKEIAKLKKLAGEADPQSFVFISDVKEIMGDFR